MRIVTADNLLRFAEQRLEPTLDLLREMVAINSFTENAPGINQLGELTAAAFAPLGFSATFHDPSNPRYGRHAVLRRDATPSAPTIAFVSHLDTVFTEEEEERNAFRWRREGARIYGPGVNDIKGGTALIHLMLAVLESEYPRIFHETNWVFLLNACEEVISADFRTLARTQLPANTAACLVFEADGGEGDQFSLVRARKGRATFTIEVHGRGAHAGSAHQQGVNAAVELARVITDLSRLTSYDEGLTINIGRIEGGTVMNRVPHFARAELEMRAFAPAVYTRAKQQILGCAGSGLLRSADAARHPSEVRAVVTDETVPWPRNSRTDHLIAHWRETAAARGLNFASEERGGLSDGNVLWDLFPTVDGLGPRGDQAHCSEQSADGSKQQEWVDVNSFVPKTVLNVSAIVRLLRSGSDADGPPSFPAKMSGCEKSE